jgi:hypothetical protein
VRYHDGEGFVEICRALLQPRSAPFLEMRLPVTFDSGEIIEER